MVPKRLKQARKLAGISQEKLGLLAGIDEATARSRISQYENGFHTPTFKLMCEIAKHLNVPEGFFYTTDDVLAEKILNYRNMDAIEELRSIQEIDKAITIINIGVDYLNTMINKEKNNKI